MLIVNYLPFQSPADLEAWFQENYAKETELWVQIFKKDSGVPSITWNDCVIASLIWGWIDGQKQSLDADAYLQRITPRRKGSNWSKRNVAHVEKLIATGKMQPPGMAHVEAAKENGRWDAAYAGSADMVMPKDFVAALDENPTAKSHFKTLTRAKKFAIYSRLISAKREVTRQKRMADFLDKLSRQKDIP